MSEESSRISYSVIALIYLLLQSVFNSHQQDIDERCPMRYDLSMCNLDGTLPPLIKPCSKAKACQKNFNITYIRKEPYNYIIIGELLNNCCGNCTRFNLTNTFNKVSDVSPEVMNASHIVFPVLARTSAERLYGHYFIPVVQPPSIYFVTERDNELLLHLINACLDMWPLLIVATLMIAIAGFFGWILETWGNVEEFPRPFLKGWFEGFWWGFILITTVGYGDKVTRSIPAKCFSVIWIIIGITMFSMITAMLTSVVGEFNTPAPPDLTGMKVGALRHRTYDSTLIAKTGGILFDVGHPDIYAAVDILIQMMKNREIDGFVLDRNTFLMFMENKVEYPSAVSYIMSKTVKTEKNYQGEKLSYGMLVRDYTDYVYLADYVLDNLDIINTCNGLVINQFVGKVKTPDANFLFSSSGDYFWPSCVTLLIVIALICVFGVFYEYYRRRRSNERETTGAELTIEEWDTET